MPPTEVFTYAVGMRTRFRGITERQGMVWRGSCGWAEWSPFLDYGDVDAATWLAAADESAEIGWPAPVRDRIGVNATIPAIGPQAAYAMAAASGCRTAKIKVAEPGQTLDEDRERVAAVRDALGADGRIRVDANGGWDVDTALEALRVLTGVAGPSGLEYAEQPCGQVEELAELRVRLARQQIGVLIAADESIRRAEDPYRVVALAAADIAVLKVQPLGGVRACLEIAEQIGLPVVVSSALETSVGIRAGIALAAALPELPFDCGLNTVALLTGDLVTRPLLATDGSLPVDEVILDPGLVERWAAPGPVEAAWRSRIDRAGDLLAARGRGDGPNR